MDAESYCTAVKTHRDETSQVIDLSPGSSRSDKVRHGTLEPDPLPLARDPSDEITACDQVPHSDQRPLGLGCDSSRFFSNAT